jgi:uncharacterized damage-inducible protein DinB
MSPKTTTAPPRETARLLDQLERAYDGDAWVGTPVRELLDDVTFRMAAARPITGGHTIWELVAHITYWLDAAARRLGGETVEPVNDADWPAMPAPSTAAWAAALAALEAGHRRLLAAVGALNEADLEGPVPGRDYTRYVLVHGVLQHTLYHAGQIALLKRATA